MRSPKARHHEPPESTAFRRFSGSRSVTRHVPPSSSISGGRASGASSGSAGAGVTVNSGSRPRSRTSTEPGARSRVISSAASDSASSSASRIADSSGAVKRSASASASCLPRGGCHGQLVAHPVHVRLQVHDVMVTSLWCHRKCQFGASASNRRRAALIAHAYRSGRGARRPCRPGIGRCESHRLKLFCPSAPDPDSSRSDPSFSDVSR